MTASVRLESPGAHQHRHLVAHDQFLRHGRGFGRVALVVFDDELDLASQDAAAGVDLVGGDPGAVETYVPDAAKAPVSGWMTPTLIDCCAAGRAARTPISSTIARLATLLVRLVI